MPYSFHLVPRTSDAARVQINHSILTDALTPPKVSTSKTTVFSPEDVFELWCEPQAVFRVRSVGRCSATLSGRSSGFREIVISVRDSDFYQVMLHLFCAVRIRQPVDMQQRVQEMLPVEYGTWTQSRQRQASSHYNPESPIADRRSGRSPDIKVGSCAWNGKAPKRF